MAALQQSQGARHAAILAGAVTRALKTVEEVTAVAEKLEDELEDAVAFAGAGRAVEARLELRGARVVTPDAGRRRQRLPQQRHARPAVLALLLVLLAMSFADAGFNTLLVDGDTRRGSLHTMFDVPRMPGLTDLLADKRKEYEVIHTTGHAKLSIMPSGHPRRSSPELLTSPRLAAALSKLRTQYDVVIIDTPPLAAGIDGYAIAAATGSALIVLRIGHTEKRMAAAKLVLVDRLPIHLVGAVLNSAPSSGEYAYYGYVEGYEAQDDGVAALPPSMNVGVN